MKKCPICSEEIQDEAIKCRYCGEWLEEHKKKVEKELNIDYDELYCLKCKKGFDLSEGIFKESSSINFYCPDCGEALENLLPKFYVFKKVCMKCLQLNRDERSKCRHYPCEKAFDQKKCPDCLNINDNSAMRCSFCGYAFNIEARKIKRKEMMGGIQAESLNLGRLKIQTDSDGNQKFIYPIIDNQSKTKEYRERKLNSTTNICFRCGSTKISVQKSGFSFSQAAAGGILAGPVGLFAGAIGKDKNLFTCLNCGYSWRM